MMKNLKEIFSKKVFKVLKWVFLILIGLFFILIIFRTFHYMDVQKTEDQVVKIHSTKLSMDDVMGKSLPVDPGIEADKTIQGVDANNNGIRDDVELAIFKEYPDSAKTRAVLLQYALALQMETIQPFVNEEIATEVVREQSRGFYCVGKIFPDRESDASYKELLSTISFVENNQFNTTERKDNRDIFLKKVRSFSDLEEDCDLDLSKLSN